MRLRQLPISQSIVFWAPPEVHQSILNFRAKSVLDGLDSKDVIIWLLEQTCCNIEELQPLYISQGLEYCRRWIARKRNPQAALEPDQRKTYLKVLEQPEQYSLERLYAPDQQMKTKMIDTSGSPEIAQFLERLKTMKKGLTNTADTVQALAHQEVEQEREVEIEVVCLNPKHVILSRPSNFQPSNDLCALLNPIVGHKSDLCKSFTNIYNHIGNRP